MIRLDENKVGVDQVFADRVGVVEIRADDDLAATAVDDESERRTTRLVRERDGNYVERPDV